MDCTALILLATAFLITLGFGTSEAYAIGPYQSGYHHGVSDAKLAHRGLGGSDWYITQPGKGFAFHTDVFNKGYIDGFCSIAGSGAGSDANEATFQCP